MFYIENLKNQLPKEIVDKLINEIREEFNNDEMMFELHLMRALKAQIQSQ
jgi:hypothetical protein